MQHATLTCPDCDTKTGSDIHPDRSVVAYDCSGCNKKIKTKDDVCCVHCSYGDTRCPVSVLDKQESDSEAEAS
jgi:hypothetical protein